MLCYVSNVGDYMTNGKLLYSFISRIKKEKLLTDFLNSVFGYSNLSDYNYIFRISKLNNQVILDIYDNVSINRFNRYVFDFDSNNYSYKREEVNNVFVNYFCIKNICDNENYLFKLAYLFSLPRNEIINYARTFLDIEFLEILNRIIK